MFHILDMKMLEQARMLSVGNGTARMHRIVGVNNDEDTHKYKAKTLIARGALRQRATLQVGGRSGARRAWVISEAFLRSIALILWRTTHCRTWTSAARLPDGDVYSFVKRRGMFLETKRTDGISTSDILPPLSRTMISSSSATWSEASPRKSSMWQNVGGSSDCARETGPDTSSASRHEARVEGSDREPKLFVQGFKPEGVRGRRYVRGFAAKASRARRRCATTPGA